ncbi:MAG: M48 family metalloprotease [Betaproteobacteria bacterium AqS2]|uniref:M48 family metalloprotease n=1 Tax=Candidatus Amphirhobacter heronislandensis TaxID=1732024 RepID=A0A930XX38_9GAMM|nr:M48 family metalloprotease [Betaproteobacteria bacterium AqS2]
MTLRLRRDGREFERAVEPRAACRSEVGIAPGAEINAYANGSQVGIARGMLNFVESDEELAFVVGHEIAHNVMDHVDITRGNMLIGSILGGLLDIAAASGGVYTGGAISSAGMEAGRRLKSVELEAEADYIGLYMLHNAGFDISGGADFWRRMGAEGGNLYASTTHPTTPQRFIAMRKTIAEIEAKAARGEPVLPTPADGR